MSKKIYDDGTLKVEQVVVKENARPAMRTMATKSADIAVKSIKCTELIDTAFSYGSAGLEVVDYGGGHDCIFCGKKTSYGNRYVCPKCWMSNKEKILEALKAKNEKVNVEIK